MPDEPTRRIPPADDPTQVQPPTAPGGRRIGQPGAASGPSPYAATQRMDPVTADHAGYGAGDRTQVFGGPAADATQVLGGPAGDATQMLPPQGTGQGGASRDFRAAAPPPARPYRPGESAYGPAYGPAPGSAEAGPGVDGGAGTQAPPTQVYGQPVQGYPAPGARPGGQPGGQPGQASGQGAYGQGGYGQQGHGQQGYAQPGYGQPGQQPPDPWQQQSAPAWGQQQAGSPFGQDLAGSPSPSPRRDRDDEGPGGAVAGAVLAWVPRLLLVLGVYQLVRLVPGFDVMPDVAQFPLFRGIGDGVLAMLNLNPEWSEQAANLTIPVLGMAIAGLLGTIRSLDTKPAVWPFGLVVFAWIVVFAVGGIVGYAQETAQTVRDDVRQSVDDTIEDAKQDATDQAREELEKTADDVQRDATENLEQKVDEQLQDVLPGGDG